jgi:RND family efflux transporter MFP subunit
MKNTIILLISISLFAQACSTSEGKNESLLKITDAIPVQLMELNLTPVATTIETSGFFSTDDETNLAFKTGGVIEKIYVKEGDPIQKGQLLATLNLTEIEAQVAQARLSFEKSKRDFERVENLYRDSVATLEQYQNTRTGMEVAKRQLEAANFNKSYSQIHSVSNGFVLRKMASEGQVISSGTTVFQTNGAGKGKWILKTSVSDREWVMINIGDHAVVTSDAVTSKALDATVTKKSESTDAMNGSFAIDLALKTSSTELASGLFGNATIQVSTKQRVWQIPYQALLDGDGQSGYVFVTQDDKTAHKISVTIGDMEKDYVTVTAGLEQAKRLIISGSAYLKEGSTIIETK